MTDLNDQDITEKETESTITWILLQIADSAFPTGGFSHSFGFESATKHGFVTEYNGFKGFLLSCLQNAGDSKLLNFEQDWSLAVDVVTAWFRWTEESLPHRFQCNPPLHSESHKNYQAVERIKELDGMVQAYLSNHVANRASIRQGNSLLDTACKTFGYQELKNLQVQLENKGLFGHFAVMFGFMCGSLNLSVVQTQQLFLFSTLRTVIASAVRLGNIGPLQAQSIQFEMQKTAEEIRKKFEISTVEEATTTAPVADFLQGAHDNLFSKLFYS